MKYIIDSFIKEQAYQRTACMILMKSLIEVKGMRVNVRIANSLNQGFFVYMDDTSSELSLNDIEKINNHMKFLISENREIRKISIARQELIELWREYDVPEKIKLLSQWDEPEQLEIYELDGYKNCFYGELLPSTGFIELYEIKRYRNGLLLRLPSLLCPDHLPEYRDDSAIYDSYAESKKLRKDLGYDYLADLNDAIIEKNIPELIKNSEEQHSIEISKLANNIVESGRRLVLIAGPSSSGKTTFAKRLCKAIAEISEEPIYMGTDDYFLDREETPLGADGEPDFENFGALDIDLFSKHINSLVGGGEIDAPEFDFIKGAKNLASRHIDASSHQIIVVEGIHSLNDELTPDIDKQLKYKIYISPLTRIGIDRHNRLSSSDARLLRRMVRDYRTRGRSAETSLRDWIKVRRGENVNIFPYSSAADFVFNSSLIYETAMLKSVAQPLLEHIDDTAEEYEDARRLIRMIANFKDITDYQLVPEESLLREFIG